MVSRRTFINYSVLRELDLQPHELLISPQTVWAMKNTNRLVLHLTQKQIEQIRTAYLVDPNLTSLELSYFKIVDYIAAAGDVQPNHAVTKPLNQYVRIAWVEAYISDNQSVWITSVDHRERVSTRVS